MCALYKFAEQIKCNNMNNNYGEHTNEVQMIILFDKTRSTLLILKKSVLPE